MKRMLLVVLGLVIIYAAYIWSSLIHMQPMSDLQDRKINLSIQVKDWHGDYHPYIVGPQNRYWTPARSIPLDMKWAVILAEDSNFYEHEGIDVKAIKNAIKYDLEKKSFARGASTITQQVVKNLFLSREKSINRKVKEIILAKRMEQELTKGRIIELYLNVIELGPMVYGIGHGAHYYFGKPASALTPRECAFIAAMLPGPRVAYNPYKNLGKVLKRSNMILRLMHSKGVLSDAEYAQAMSESPNVGRMQRKVDESIKKDEVLKNISSAKQPGSPPTTDNEEQQTDVSPAPNATSGAPEIKPPQGNSNPPDSESEKP